MSMLDTLESLSGQVPQLNQQAVKQAKAATTMQLQQQVAAAPTNVPQTAVQQAATQQQAQAAQIQLQGTQATQQQLQQLGTQALQVTGREKQDVFFRRQLQERAGQQAEAWKQELEISRVELASRKKITEQEIQTAQRVQQLGMEQDNKLQLLTINQRKQLNRLGNDVKDKIFDARTRFERDEMGRRFTNERQLADWRLTNLQNEQQFQQEMQRAKFTHQRHLDMMKYAHQSIQREIDQGFKLEQQGLEFAHKEKLFRMRKEAEKAIKDKANYIANNTAMHVAGGTVIGAAVGIYFGGVAGGVVGAGVGAGVGGLVAGAENDQYV